MEGAVEIEPGVVVDVGSGGHILLIGPSVAVNGTLLAKGGGRVETEGAEGERRQEPAADPPPEH